MTFRVKPEHLANFPVSEIAVTDSGGDYVSDWIDAADILTIRVAAYTNNGASDVTIREAFSDEGIEDGDINGGPVYPLVATHVLQFSPFNTATPSYVPSTDINLTGRYFRYEINNATNSGAWVNVVIRKVS